MNIAFIFSIIIFIAALAMVIAKPRGIDIGYSSLIWALVTIILGLITLEHGV